MEENYGVKQIPTQPADMGKELQKKSSGREEIAVLIIFMLLAVVLTWGAFACVSILQRFSGPVFEKVENSGISIKSLSSLSAFRRMRISGSLAIGVLLAVAFLSRGVTTLLCAIAWGIADLIMLLVLIKFISNSAKREKTRPMDIAAIVVSAFAMLTTIYMPYEIATNFASPKYWIPGTHNSISFWVMLPCIVWSAFLVVYFIYAVAKALSKQ